jgi:replicative DNA helicase
MGKTALAQTLALNIARAKVAVGFFSLEMSAKELASRFISMQSNITTQQMRKPKERMGLDDWRILADLRYSAADLPLFIDCTSALTTAALRARAERMATRHGLGLLLIDYIGLLRLGDKCESRNHEVGQISRDLKELAKELKIPVVVMCQLSRQPERRQDHRPQLADLRDSGELEQNADIVIGIHREAYYQETDENKNKAELLILKHRNGATGVVDVCFLKEYTRFENLEFSR